MLGGSQNAMMTLVKRPVRFQMKKKPIILSILITGLICLPVGVYIGEKLLPKDDVRPLINVMAMEDSFELSRSAILLEALNKGKTQEVIDVLYVEIKNKLELEDDYSNFELLDDTIRRVKENRQKRCSPSVPRVSLF